jgi:hypothetical protein
MVAGSSFLWLLAALTVATGVVLVVMVWRRLKRPTERATAPSAQRTILPRDPDPLPEPEEMALEDVDIELEPDEVWGKICPACHSRYGHHVSTCTRDDSELAMLN